MAKRRQHARWEAQPRGPVGINWGHQRADGLCFFAPLNADHHLRDLAGEQRATRTGLEAINSAQDGSLYYLFGTSNFADFQTVPAAIGPSTPFTIAWTQEARATSGQSTIINVNFGTAGVHFAFAIYQSSTANGYEFTAGPRTSGGAHSWSSALGVTTNDRLDRYVLRASGGSQSTTASEWTLYRNGALVTRGTSATFSSFTTAGFRVGARDTGADPWEGLIGDLRMWARVLGEDEAEQESTIQGAWDLYGPAQIWVPGAAPAPPGFVTAWARRPARTIGAGVM